MKSEYEKTDPLMEDQIAFSIELIVRIEDLEDRSSFREREVLLYGRKIVRDIECEAH